MILPEIKDLNEEFEEWRVALQEALAMANDPFKAPEQVVGMIKPIMDAAWKLQLAYYATIMADRMTREGR